jgi:hypothetical protein
LISYDEVKQVDPSAAQSVANWQRSTYENRIPAVSRRQQLAHADPPGFYLVRLSQAVGRAAPPGSLRVVVTVI